HLDINVTNLMVTYTSGNYWGVLNDFDFASDLNRHEIKTPGRTGTWVFMAYDFLSDCGLRGEKSHLYLNDFESFCWVFLWICSTFTSQHEILSGPPLEDWTDGPESSRYSKSHFFTT
ncbi:hypothetical protein CPB83DRAFT_753269, partial [Crepidotus variabilis]